ncbi:hypothetical protein HDU67_003025 [Dinochytrium kinnereticum]|nr:hypothetical protein HDU67_003025 [Dinochytrium kinnereticum]
MKITRLEADAQTAGTESYLTRFNEIKSHINIPFESMDSLLNCVSPGYRDNFQERLCRKLADIAKAQEESSYQ